MRVLINFTLLIMLALICSCSRYLDEKSDTSLAVPETLADNQALMDRYFNLGAGAVSAELSADDIYVTDVDFATMPIESHKRLYTWQPNYVAAPSGNDWENSFGKINIFNTVLFNISHYNISGAENLRGQALVFRAASYLEAVQIWALAYDHKTANDNLGLPLRLTPDMNVPSVRATLKETYDQILSDLHAAVDLLPVKQIAPTRPSKVTALGYLSRTYLYMGDYQNALKYGKEALELYPHLIDFNTLNSASSFPISEMNVEVLLPTSMAYSPFFTSSKAKIHDSLYKKYVEDDLRKYVFFRITPNGEVLFKGNYSGNSGRMTCLATDEIYLNVAESYAMTGNISAAINQLNKLLVKRWKSGTFIPFQAASQQEAVAIIRAERRKELLFRGLRWADLKRYNREGAQIDLTKIINGVSYHLPHNDLRYAIAIPEDIIEMTNMLQNPR